MYLPKWGIGAALLSAVALVGCQEGGMNEVQDEQEDVIEAEQELSEEQAELNQAEEKAAIENVENGEALELNDPTVTPPLPGEDEEMTAPGENPAAGENPFTTPPEPAAPDPTTPSTDPEPASEAADNAATTNGDDSADGAAETPAPAPAPEE